MYPEAIEQALEHFFESSRYQEALDAHLKLVETAFVRGWLAAKEDNRRQFATLLEQYKEENPRSQE